MIICEDNIWQKSQGEHFTQFTPNIAFSAIETRFTILFRKLITDSVDNTRKVISAAKLTFE